MGPNKIKCHIRLGANVAAVAQELIILAHDLIPEGSDTTIIVKPTKFGVNKEVEVTVNRDTTFMNILKQYGFANEEGLKIILDHSQDKMSSIKYVHTEG